MMNGFISDVESLTWPGFSGQVLRARFFVANYCEEYYHQQRIPLSNDLAAACQKRQAEYLAGRILAKQLLTAMGYGDFILVNGADRAPIWAPGIVGSLSHNLDRVLCAVCCDDAHRGVGIDIETLLDAEQAQEVQTSIMTQEEGRLLADLSMSFGLTLTFSAKESLFKALYPQVGRFFDFLDAMLIELDKDNRTFKLMLLKSLNAEFFAGRCFTGYWQDDENAVMTLVVDR